MSEVAVKVELGLQQLIKFHRSLISALLVPHRRYFAAVAEHVIGSICLTSGVNQSESLVFALLFPH